MVYTKNELETLYRDRKRTNWLGQWKGVPVYVCSEANYNPMQNFTTFSVLYDWNNYIVKGSLVYGRLYAEGQIEEFSIPVSISNLKDVEKNNKSACNEKASKKVEKTCDKSVESAKDFDPLEELTRIGSFADSLMKNIAASVENDLNVGKIANYNFGIY